MRITGNGITLRRIEKADLEQIRIWRNSESIRSQMEYQEVISPVMQEEWYRKVQLTSDYFFMILKNENPVGLIQLQNISPQNKNAESGLFIGDTKYWGSPVPFMASLPLLDFGFNFLGLHAITAKVRVNNSKALHYNMSLGFKPNRNLNRHFRELIITPRDFENAVSKQPAFRRFTHTYTLHSSLEILKQSPPPSGLFISPIKDLSER